MYTRSYCLTIKVVCTKFFYTPTVSLSLMPTVKKRKVKKICSQSMHYKLLLYLCDIIYAKLEYTSVEL